MAQVHISMPEELAERLRAKVEQAKEQAPAGSKITVTSWCCAIIEKALEAD